MGSPTAGPGWAPSVGTAGQGPGLRVPRSPETRARPLTRPLVSFRVTSSS